MAIGKITKGCKCGFRYQILSEIEGLDTHRKKLQIQSDETSRLYESSQNMTDRINYMWETGLNMNRSRHTVDGKKSQTTTWDGAKTL